MKVIAPLNMTDAILSASNVPEADAPAWAIGTTYALDAEVIVLSVHRVYRSAVAGNVGHDPVTDDGTNWIELGATNRWKAFDKRISDPVTQLDRITYDIIPTTFVSGIGFLQVGAAKISVEVLGATATRIYYRELDRTSGSAIIDYWTFFTVDISQEDVPDAIFDGVTGFPSNTLRITLEAVNDTSVVSVGQIVIGSAYQLGTSTSGTSIGIRDFSSKDRDQFGNAMIVERAFADTTTFQFALETRRGNYVKNILSSLRATPALYYVSEDAVPLGAQTYGFFQDFEIPLSAGGTSFANLKIEGLT